MINANELRIGNYVNPCHNNNSLGVILPITGIIARVFTHEFFKCKLANDITLSFAEQECYDYEINMIEPIPITEEWLLKFGFDFNPSWKDRFDCQYAVLDTGYLFLGASIGFKSVTLFQNNGISTGIHLDYIHQLQNLYFSLTGEEITLSVT